MTILRLHIFCESLVPVDNWRWQRGRRKRNEKSTKHKMKRNVSQRRQLRVDIVSVWFQHFFLSLGRDWRNKTMEKKWLRKFIGDRKGRKETKKKKNKSMMLIDLFSCCWSGILLAIHFLLFSALLSSLFTVALVIHFSTLRKCISASEHRSKERTKKKRFYFRFFHSFLSLSFCFCCFRTIRWFVGSSWRN